MGFDDGMRSKTSPLLVAVDEEDPHRDSAAGDMPSFITPVLVLSTFIAGCGSFCYGYAMGYSSPAQSGIMAEMGLSLAQYSIFGSIMTIGGMIGAIFSGKITDMFGRRRAMMLSAVACIPGWLAITFAKDALWLEIGRMLIGFAVGVSSFVVPVYIAEIAPKQIRGRFTSINLLMTNYGFAVAFFMGNIISWRTLSLIAVVPCVVQLVGLFFIPESPRWLAKVGREKEVQGALQRLRGKKDIADIFQEAEDIREISEAFQPGKDANPLKLFQKKNAYPMIVVVGLMLLQQLGGISALAFYTSTIFTKAGFSTTIGSTSLSIMQIPVTLIAVLLMDAFGRRTLLMVSSAGACLSLLLVAVSFHLKELQYLDDLTPLLVFLGISGYVAAFGIGMGGIPWVLMSEILPIDVKASGGSIATLTNWSVSWLITYTFNFALEWNPASTFFFFAAMSLVAVFFTWKLVPETRGRTLEEIQQLCS
ncbi:unnamed protein product [Linum tenue]|uniref:Major facilitator superfamily (MFS) profile domain-containing protein n=2 Tax=Linum tenue TaxID=586396 RepID=A0AAV0HFB7_9ROSI|nr:unnamed protein product [Linum tenue]